MKFEDVKTDRIKMFDSQQFLERIKDEDIRMLKYLPLLKKMNEYSFITIESQAGVGKKYKTHIMSEKSYIIGFIQESKAENFIKHLSINSDKNCLIIYNVDDNFDIPAKFDIPLTIEKKNNEIKVVTHTSTVLPQNWYDMYKKEIRINKSEKVILLLCFDPKFNRDAKNKDGLFIDVIKSLKAI
jgi:hypothetical protein